MSWICIEGVDRSGKSTLAKYYESQGYELVHMGPPDKKYFQENYSGESYFEEIVRLYSKYDGRDVVFDRTIYGELIWSKVYGREQMLTEDDLEYLSHMERNNDTSKILMYDEDLEAHWQRCVDNNEPLTRQQFGRANTFYNRLVQDYGFQKKQLSDFPELMPEVPVGHGSNGSNNVQSTQSDSHESSRDTDADEDSNSGAQRAGSARSKQGDNSDVGSIEDKLARANAIRTLLSGKIVKKKGEIFDELEESIREFLNEELDKIFAPKPDNTMLTEDETTVLKQMARRIIDKMEI